MRNTNNSAKLYRRASELMPGGVSSPVRAFLSVGGTPIYYKNAQGSHFVDEDGNDYVDFCMSWGPLILGHAHPAVVEAVCRAARDGLSFGACCKREIELAERILAALPGMDQLRFVSSGTEAVMTAIRLARGVTGRPGILKFAGGYHGHSDSLLVKAGSGLVTFGSSSSLGVPESFAAQTIVCPFDDLDALEQIFKAQGDKLAAAIVEPLPANNGLLEQRPNWLAGLRDLCSRHGVLLILDEVITGFRLRYGGLGDALGVKADIITLGKVIGGGMPVGALCASHEIMKSLAPLGGVYQAGTLSGNPVSLAAGIATLDQLAGSDAYDRLEQLGSAFENRLADLRAGRDWLNLKRRGSLFWLHLAEGELPRRADAISEQSAARYNGMHAVLLERGFYLAPSAYEVAFISTAHTTAEVERLADEISSALENQA